MRRVLKMIGWGFVILILGLLAVASIVGRNAPDTAVYPGDELPKKYLATLYSLNLLEPDEQVLYFYSDGFMNIESGLYFVTDKKLVVYSDRFEVPKTIIPFDQIASIRVDYDDSFFVDSMVHVTTHSGDWVRFPVSSEQGRDEKFVEAITVHLDVIKGTSPEAIDTEIP